MILAQSYWHLAIKLYWYQSPCPKSEPSLSTLLCLLRYVYRINCPRHEFVTGEYLVIYSKETQRWITPKGPATDFFFFFAPHAAYAIVVRIKTGQRWHNAGQRIVLCIPYLFRIDGACKTCQLAEWWCWVGLPWSTKQVWFRENS